MEEVFAKYAEKFHFLVLYQREAHAGELAFRDIEQPVTMEEREKLAARCRSELGVTTTIVLDGMDNAVREAYGGLPNSAYIIDKGGEIVFKQAWARSGQWPAILDKLIGG